jgi:hypothetical protein
LQELQQLPRYEEQNLLTSSIRFSDEHPVTTVESAALGYDDRVYRRILTAKGQVVPLRLMQQNFRGSLRAAQIFEAMQKLSNEGLGYVMQDCKRGAKFFRKMHPESVQNNPHFSKYLLSIDKYTEHYYYSKPAPDRRKCSIDTMAPLPGVALGPELEANSIGVSDI